MLLAHIQISSTQIKMKPFIIFTLVIILALSQKHNVTQVTERTFQTQLQKAQFSILYVYSSSCGFCQQFTPLYEKLSKDTTYVSQSVRFLKADESLFQNYTEKFSIFSYPTVMLFWRGYNQYPIPFRQQRTQANMRQFITKAIKINEDKIDVSAELSPYQRVDEKIVLYYGTQSSPLYKHLGLVSNRDGFFSWKMIQTKQGEQERIIIGNKQLSGQDLTVDELQKIISKVFARVHTLSEQPWVRIFMNKQLGIVHINPKKNSKYSQLLQSLAKQNPNIVFMDLSPQHPEYKDALRTFAIYDEQNIIAVDRKLQAIFVANQPYKKESLKEFIQKVENNEWPVYQKTQKTTKQQKLTRENFKQRMSTPQDVVLFLYRRQQKISKNLIDLFNHLRNKLQQNKNLLFLRCDVASNQIQEYLQFTVQTTPKLVFYRNRMKDRPIHFQSNKISQSSVIEFIMENTTFDWEDQWGEL